MKVINTEQIYKVEARINMYIFISSVSCSILHPTRIPSHPSNPIHPIPYIHICLKQFEFPFSPKSDRLEDNLAPVPIWHRSQFGTKSVKRSIWHQECKRVNLAPVPIWHQECKGVNLAPVPIWHRTNLAPRVQKSQFDTGTNLTPEPI